MNMPAVHISDYDYALPPQSIAQYPAPNRDASKLLIYRHASITDDYFYNLRRYLPDGCLLVFNDSKVIPARLMLKTAAGASIEALCLQPHQPSDYEHALLSENGCVWRCMIGNLRRWKSGILTMPFSYNGIPATLTLKRLGMQGAQAVVEFGWDAMQCTFADVLSLCGSMPLPPYLQRAAMEEDTERYQTIYARHAGSAAAPTAGLHFTAAALESLRQSGIAIQHITLHVGAGTFLPVKTIAANDHIMHAEYCIVQKECLRHIRGMLGNVFAVGTTSARALESLYWLGAAAHKEKRIPASLAQWQAYEFDDGMSAGDALDALLCYMESNDLQQIEYATQMMIMPHYKYRIVGGIITNFHQPRSTLLLLVAALTGDAWRSIYQHALRQGYRFLSYGDSSLLYLH